MVNVGHREIGDPHDFEAPPAFKDDDGDNEVIISGIGPHAGAGGPQ